jgi:hypothetical protein
MPHELFLGRNKPKQTQPPTPPPQKGKKKNPRFSNFGLVTVGFGGRATNQSSEMHPLIEQAKINHERETYYVRTYQPTNQPKVVVVILVVIFSIVDLKRFFFFFFFVRIS